jgi:hypothetical protein
VVQVEGDREDDVWQASVARQRQQQALHGQRAVAIGLHWGVCSIEPNDSSGEVDGGEEVSGELVIAGSDGAVLLELAEEIFDEMAGLVEVCVVSAAACPIALGWDDRGLAGGNERIENPGIGIEGIVGDQGLGGEMRQESVRSFQIVRLPCGQQELDWVAERVDQGVDLGAQSAFAGADRLVLAAFLGAPALC